MNGNIVTITDCDRVMAFLLYKGRMYESDSNHQECLAEILNDEGSSYMERYGFPLYDEYVDNTDRAAEITYEMMHNEEVDVVGFDLWEIGNELLFACHLKQYADKYMLYIREFAEKRKYRYGYYIDDDTVLIVV